MGLDKKKLVCGNCQYWEVSPGRADGLTFGRCARISQPPMLALNPACHVLREDADSFTDRGYKGNKVDRNATWGPL
jgi:hypothetical protein